MSERIERLEAELKLAKLEQKLIDAKSTKAGPSQKLKLEVRNARAAFRTQYREQVTVQPATVSTKAKSPTPGVSS